MSELARAIRRIAVEGTAAGSHRNGPGRVAMASRAGVVALALLPAATHGLTVGELRLQSALGEPLRATVPLQTAPGEQVDPACVTAVPELVTGATALSPVQVALRNAGGGQQLVLTTARPLYEPMYELALRLSCPGTPTLVRQFVLMLDLPGMLAEAAPPVVAPVAAPAPRPAPAARENRSAVSQPAAATPAAPVQGGTRYVVQPGDTLSSIAQRVQGRQVGIWAMAQQIFAANADRFPGGNPDRLPAGVELIIPGEGVLPATTPAVRSNAWQNAAALPPVTSEAPALPTNTPAVDGRAEDAAASLAAAEPVQPLPAGLETDTGFDPDAVADAISDAVEVAAAMSPAAAAEPAVVPTRTVAPADSSTESSWTDRAMAVGAGAGFGLLMSLLLFGRRLRRRREQHVAVPAHTAAPPARAGQAAKAAPVAAPVRTVRPEPAISVSFEESLDEPLARRFGRSEDPEATVAVPAPETRHQPSLPDDITADLEQLFLDEDTAITRQMPEATGRFDQPSPAEATGRFPRASEGTGRFQKLMAAPEELDPLTLGIDTDELTQLANELPVDIGEQDPFSAGDGLSPTGELPGARPAFLDLPDATMEMEQDRLEAERTRMQTQTIIEAMELLERDYEEEFTASQLLDQDLVQAALEGGPDDPEATGVRRRR